jgi:hypothetical protein
MAYTPKTAWIVEKTLAVGAAHTDSSNDEAGRPASCFVFSLKITS